MSSGDNIRRFVRYVTLGETAPNSRTIVPQTRNVEFDFGHGSRSSGFTGRAPIFYSYGRHFPLAEYHDAKRGRAAYWLINGDVWPRRGWSSTADHQSATRSAIAEAIADAAKRGRTTGTVTIPFSALDAANIARDSIRVLGTRPERNDTFTRSVTFNPADVFAPVPPCPDVANPAASNWHDNGGRFRHERRATLPVITTGDAAAMVRAGFPPRRTESVALTRGVTWHEYSDAVTVDVACHECYGRGSRTGYSLTSAVRANAERETVTCAKCGGTGKVSRDGGWRAKPAPDISYSVGHSGAAVTNDDGTITVTWQTWRHWLGDVVFTAATRDSDKRRRYVSSFDYNEPRPLYFLATLPSTSRARTVDTAVLDLAPDAVHDAVARGADVRRQGDIFFVATSYSDADMAAIAVDRARLTMWTRGAKPRKGETGYVAPLTAAERAANAAERRASIRAALRANLTADRRPSTPNGWRADKRAKIAAELERVPGHTARIAAGDNVCQCGTNYNGNGALCVTCHLPIYYYGYTADNAERGLARIAERVAVLTAESRVTVRARGYCSTGNAWQKTGGGHLTGRCYNRAVDSARRITDEIAYRRVPRSADTMAAARRVLSIYGTAHTASDVIVTASGATYARGVVRHVPEIDGTGNRWRTADHRPLHLAADVWYLAIRNTVPRASGAR